MVARLENALNICICTNNALAQVQQMHQENRKAAGFSRSSEARK
jgi:hypothetical protein